MSTSVSYQYNNTSYTFSLTGSPTDETTQLGMLQQRIQTVQQNISQEGAGAAIYVICLVRSRSMAIRTLPFRKSTRMCSP